MGDFISVHMTIDSEDGAKRISMQLLNERLIVCAQIIGPIRSLYWWKGKVEGQEEWLCIFKSKGSLFNKMEARIKELHPYEVPEIIAVPIGNGNKEYLEWIGNEVTS